ncbi:hypothetical protein GCM10007417_28760 [Glycocaulis alkaliphilus]|nr:hypothetical protein GCM10007417_28760 [Glycocaulis alkaliphilus]
MKKLEHLPLGLVSLDPMSLISAGGSALSGIAEVIGNIGQVRRQKKVIQAQEDSQKRLMDYQNEIERANTEDNRAYNEAYEKNRYEQYESLQAQVRDAKAAGLSADSVAGGASGGSTSAGAAEIGGVSVPSAPVVPERRDASHVLAGLSKIATAVGEYQQQTNSLKAQNLDLQAKEEALRQQKTEGAMKFMNLLLKGEEVRDAPSLYKHKRAARNQDYTAWSLSNRQAMLSYLTSSEDFQEKQDQHKFNQDEREHQRKVFKHQEDLFDIEKRIQTLNRILLENNVNESNWRKTYRKIHGRNPEKSLTLGDWLSNLALGSDEEGTGTVTDFLNKFRNQISNASKSRSRDSTDNRRVIYGPFGEPHYK